MEGVDTRDMVTQAIHENPKSRLVGTLRKSLFEKWFVEQQSCCSFFFLIRAVVSSTSSRVCGYGGVLPAHLYREINSQHAWCHRMLKLLLSSGFSTWKRARFIYLESDSSSSQEHIAVNKEE
jgi:hypothetical protein